MDYIAFCQRFTLATGVPVHLLEKGSPVHLLEKGSPVYTSLKPLSSVSSAARWNMWVSSKNPEFLAQMENLEYGRVRIEGTDYDIIIGPLFVTPITEEIVDEFLSDYQTPQENRADASDTLYSLPLISHYLYHSCLVMGDTLREKRIGALVKGQKYAVRVDAFNENGIAHGRTRFL